MTARALPAAALLALAACGSGPPGAIPAEGMALDVRPVARFVHHQGEAREIAFTPDGRVLIATGTDGRIELMRGATGTVWRTMEHPGGASPLALSPDGTMLVSGGYDGMARIWRVADQRPVRVLAGSAGTIWTVAWSPDGSRIATAGEDRLIRIWNAADGALLNTLSGHELNIWSVRFSPDSRLLASGGDDSTLRIWRVSDGAQLAALTGGSEHIYAVAFSPDGRWLASGGRARSAIGTFWHQVTGGGAKGPAVRLWRVADGALQATLEESDDVMALAFSPNGRLLATASADGTNAVWSLVPR